MKGIRDENRPTTRSHSTKPPEDHKKTKSRNAIVMDESSKKEASEEEAVDRMDNRPGL
jgi:hypothetical protein